mmetsp:Transcript_67514/g.187181  ORF Transcript_67514/g.187181 Transcript_67514/m.187181 type:complete len:405 (-) Transcript_67514:1208-2422(-)
MARLENPCPTKTNTKRTPWLWNLLASVLMTKLLRGMPSVITTMVGCAPGRPSRSSIPAARATAAAVLVDVSNQGMSLSLEARAFASGVSACASAAESPKYTTPACVPFSSRFVRATSAWAKRLAAPMPSAPALPDESKTSKRSRLEAHLLGGVSSHGCLLQASLWRLSGLSSGWQLPSPRAGCRTYRRRKRWPALQALLQADHSDQGKSTQSWSHGWGLQSFSCIVSTVGKPPCSGVRTTRRLRVFVPPPQAREHADQALHRPMSPSTGQGRSLQDRLPRKGGHFRCSPVGPRTTSRVMFCKPPLPHGLEQGPKTHSVTSQSPKKAPWDPNCCRSVLVLHIVADKSSNPLLQLSSPRLASRAVLSTWARRSRRIASSSSRSPMVFASSMLLLSAWRFKYLISPS